jgi:hypothetical protein
VYLLRARGKRAGCSTGYRVLEGVREVNCGETVIFTSDHTLMNTRAETGRETEVQEVAVYRGCEVVDLERTWGF